MEYKPVGRIINTTFWAAFLVILGSSAGSALFSPVVPAQRQFRVSPSQSGGPLLAEQAAYDVRYYRLDLTVDPEARSISGRLLVSAEVVAPMEWLVLDLDDALQVASVHLTPENEQAVSLPLERRPGRLWIRLQRTWQPGETLRVEIQYGGIPREAPHPPWVGGFVWSHTEDGSPWLGVACQTDGADLWWPVKDHPSDEPDSMDLRITVPEPLTVASNGTLQQIVPNPDQTRTFHWHISNPINVYNVTINIAPYRTIESEYMSTSGQNIPLIFWVLPENYEKGVELFRQFPRHLRFLEETLGPYPFQDEKYGVAETSYLGMEHQTIISYGNQYRNNRYGFDWLHFHELAHEWWGNLVTAADWKDHWIHEGLASYMDALYAESLEGETALIETMAAMRPRLRNLMAVAPLQSQTVKEKYFVPPHYTESDGDVNFKGAWILHTLRYLVGDQDFFRILKQFAYPNTGSSQKTGRCPCRFVSSIDFQTTAEEITGRSLSWFFDLYLHQPQLPKLETKVAGGMLKMRWRTPNRMPFPMPVEVKLADRIAKLDLSDGEATLPLDGASEFEIDPGRWLLMEEEKQE